MTYEISPHLKGIIEPLCEATCKLLREEKYLQPQDYVLISVEDDVYEEHDGIADAVHTKRFVIKFKSRDVNQHPSYALRNTWWQRIPGATTITNAYGCYAPPSDMTALVVMGALGRNRIEFEDEVAELEFMTMLLRFAKQVKLTKGPAGFKAFRSIPGDAPTGNPKYPPMPAQRVAAWAAKQSEAYALWMEQSTGKTYAAIMAIEETLEKGQCQMILIGCPKNVRTQWANELNTFASKRVKVIRFVGGDIERRLLLLEAFKAKLSGDYDYVVVITSYQIAVNSCTQICAYPWDWCVLDEGHGIKYYRAKRSMAFHRIRDKSKRRLELTGTPIANTMFDLYSQLEFLGRGWSGFTSYTAFKKFYGKWDKPSGRGVERVLSLKNVPLLQERLARMSFMLKKTEALPDLPAKTYDIIEVEMTDEQREIYNALADQLYAEIEHDLAQAEAGKKTITVNNILVKMLRLSQVTSGFCVMDGETDPDTGKVIGERPVNRFDPNPKVEELVEFIKNLEPTSKCLVWCLYIQDIKTIKARLELEGIKCTSYYGATAQADREALELEWNTNPDLKVIVGNPAAGGVGLNLQGYCPMGDDSGDYTKCDTVVFFSQGWSSIPRSQGEERPRGYVHESKTVDGKRVSWSIRVVDLCILDSIDFQIRKRVTDKRMHALKVQDVREILGRLLVREGE